jgi:nucleotide-binding universal stress UspA family protein
MGAYGRSRMRELIFGGVTRHIARHMTARTLWSH